MFWCEFTSLCRGRRDTANKVFFQFGPSILHNSVLKRESGRDLEETEMWILGGIWGEFTCKRFFLEKKKKNIIYTQIIFSELRLQSWNVLSFFCPSSFGPVRCVSLHWARPSAAAQSSLDLQELHLVSWKQREKKNTRGESVKSRISLWVRVVELGAKLTQALQELVDSTGLRLRIGVQVIGHSHLKQTWNHKIHDSRRRLARMIRLRWRLNRVNPVFQGERTLWFIQFWVIRPL